MKELLKEFSQSNDFEYNEPDKTAYAFKNGYGIYVKQDKKNYIFSLICNKELDGMFLGGTKIAGKDLMVTYENGALTAKMEIKQADNVLVLSAISQRLFAAASAAQLTSSCSECDGNFRLNIVKNNNDYILLCEDCRAVHRQKLKENVKLYQDIKIRKIDALGAFTAAIIGIIIYIVAYQVGSPTVILGGIMGFAVSMGYQRAGGVFAHKGARFCSSLCVASIAIAEFFSIGVTLFLANFWNKITIWQAIAAVPNFLSGPGAAWQMVQDLIGASGVMMLTMVWAYLRAKKARH